MREMTPRLFPGILLLSLPAFSAQPFHANLGFASIPAGATPAAVAVDTAGNFVIASTFTTPYGQFEIRIDKVDASGNSLGDIEFASNAEAFLFVGNPIGGIAVDRGGNVVIATTSVTNTLVNLVGSVNSVSKIDPQLKNVLFTKQIGGKQGFTGISALTLDAVGNIYVAGQTSAADFPTTPGAFQMHLAPGASYAFVTEISSSGGAVLSSTLYGDDAVLCPAPADVCQSSAYTTASAIAVDSSGNVTIAGYTVANHLPITPGAFGQSCGDCGIPSSYAENLAGFIAKFSPGSTKLLAAIYIPVAAAGMICSSIEPATLAIDAVGNIILGGSTSSVIPATPGALQSAFPDSSSREAGFVMKLDSNLQKLLFSTYFGGTASTGAFAYGGVSGLTLDSQGNLWMTGGSPPDLLPPMPGIAPLGSTYVAALSADGSSVAALFPAPEGIAGLGITVTANGFTALGSTGALLTVSPGAAPSVVSIASSAGSAISNAVAPFELVSLYGLGIGPDPALSGHVSRGVLGSTIDDVQVLFDGIPAPLLYAGPTQINAVVPQEIAGKNTTAIEVITPAVRIKGPVMQVSPSQPGVVLSARQDPDSLEPFAAAALNEDGTINSPENPANFGSVVSVWVSGAGISTSSVPDGTIRNPKQIGGPTLPVAAFSVAVGVFVFGGFPIEPSGPLSLEVDFAGDAAGMVAGVTQVNFRLPPQPAAGIEGVVSGPPVAGVQIQVGDAKSEAFTIYVDAPP